MCNLLSAFVDRFIRLDAWRSRVSYPTAGAMIERHSFSADFDKKREPRCNTSRFVISIVKAMAKNMP